MIKFLVVIFSLSLLCLVGACSRGPSTAQPTPQPGTEPGQGKKVTSTSVVMVMPEPVEIAAGESGEAKIRLSIQDGYHVNANPATHSYLKATELEIPASEGLSVGFIVYPDPLKRKFSFDEQTLGVYEGETVLKVSLKAARSAKKGARHLSGKLRIQACDDEVCYPPGTIDLSIPIQVK